MKKNNINSRLLQIIDDVKGIISSSKSLMLFSDVLMIENLKSLFKEYLLLCGYVIKEPRINKNNIQNAEQLVSYFYECLELYKGAGYYSVNRKLDIITANKFINYRQEALRCEHQGALQDCIEIITILIKYEPEFNFRFAIKEFSQLNNDRLMDVITRIAYDIIRGVNGALVDARFQKDWEQSLKEYIDEYGEDSLLFDTVKEELDAETKGKRK